jgi:hypothetical protein
MVVEKIKALMELIHVNQILVAELLTEYTGKKYTQSMISKRLKDDKNLLISDFQLIYGILESKYQEKKSDSLDKLTIEYFFQDL